MSGTHWLVEAYGCTPAPLADPSRLSALFDRIVADLALTPVGEARWHRFPDPGGVTGLLMLAESHLSVHTWPEHGSLCLDLFCCRPRPAWDFARGLAEAVGAERVSVRMVGRSYAAGVPPAPRPRGIAGVAGVATPAPAVRRGGVAGGVTGDGGVGAPTPVPPATPSATPPRGASEAQRARGYPPSHAEGVARLRP